MDDELDNYARHTLEPLKTAPDPQVNLLASQRAAFLARAEQMRQGLINSTETLQPSPAPKGLSMPAAMPWLKIAWVVLIVLVLLAASSVTVLAAQSSLPGEPLYPVKSWSEDLRLAVTASSQARLDLTLSLTERRLGEVSSLVSAGKPIPANTSQRFQDEMDSALQLAAEMDDEGMLTALGAISEQAKSQGLTLQELISRLPPQAEPALVHLQQRLQEQVDLSAMGEKDPAEFRTQVHDRRQTNRGHGQDNPTDESRNPGGKSGTPNSNNEGGGNHSGSPTEEPGQGGQKPGNDNPSATPDGGDGEPESTPSP